jgi:hypothetical protein
MSPFAPGTIRALYILTAALGVIAIARAILGFALGPAEASMAGSVLPNLVVLLLVGAVALLTAVVSLVNRPAAGTHSP